MLFFVYLDEGSDAPTEYQAATALIFHNTNIHAYRIELIRRLREAFNRDDGDATPFPTLHAMKLPPFDDDSLKLRVFSAVVQTAFKHCFGIFREGYSNSHSCVKGKMFGQQLSDVETARVMAFSTIRRGISSVLNENILFIQEMDSSSYLRTEHILNYTSQVEQLAQLEIISGQSRPELANDIGYFYTDKRDHCLYAADFVSYFLQLQDKVTRTPFQEQLLTSCEDIRPDLVLRNRIID